MASGRAGARSIFPTQSAWWMSSVGLKSWIGGQNTLGGKGVFDTEIEVYTQDQ